MGDDLTAARRFCNSVRSDMSALIDGVSAQPCAAPDILIGSLDSIQSGAKQLKARAIFRAAQTVVNAVNDRAPLPTLQGRILSLNKLFTQYEDGLDDIAPRPANGALADHELLPKLSETKSHDEALDARYTAARQALAPLMGFTQDRPEREDLIKLAGFTAAELKTTAAEEASSIDAVLEPLFQEPADITEQPDAVLPKSIAAPLFTQPAAMKSLRQIDAARHVEFETLMPDFISHALQEARQSDKTVSVSYAAEDVSVAYEQLTAFQSLLSHIAKRLVGSVLERPETRRGRGLSGAGHIAITATQTSGKISVSIECPGKALAASAYMPTGQSVEGLIITPGGEARADHAHIVLTAPRRPRAAPDMKPLSSTSTEMAL